MTAKLISQDEDGLTIQVKISFKKTLLESEEAILEAVNQIGALATAEAIKQFDTDGSPILVGGVKYTARCKSQKNYQTPYDVVQVDRYVYQTSKGGKIYCPLESNARIIQGATPRLAKIPAHKYANLAAPSVVEDMLDNHDRKITISYMQSVADYVGSIAQAKEESWEYQTPELNESIGAIGISLDGAYVLTVNNGYREAMVGSISFYDPAGERLHTIYTARH